jgi:hypothetical protein
MFQEMVRYIGRKIGWRPVKSSNFNYLKTKFVLFHSHYQKSIKNCIFYSHSLTKLLIIDLRSPLIPFLSKLTFWFTIAWQCSTDHIIWGYEGGSKPLWTFLWIFHEPWRLPQMFMGLFCLFSLKKKEPNTLHGLDTSPHLTPYNNEIFIGYTFPPIKYFYSWHIS